MVAHSQDSIAEAKEEATMSVPEPIDRPEERTPGENRWVIFAVYLCPFIFMALLMIVPRARGITPEKPSGLGPAFLFLCFLLLFRMWIYYPEEEFAGDYDLPPGPGPELGRWRLEPPWPLYQFVLIASALWFEWVGVLMFLDSQSQLDIAEVFGLALVGLIAIIACFMYRRHPWLDVDEVRKELIWQPASRWDDLLTLPFSAVKDVRVGHKPHHPGLYHPEIEWRTAKRRTRTTLLPGSAKRESVEAVVVRLRTALGVTGEGG
jgi:hypothetical protein